MYTSFGMIAPIFFEMYSIYRKQHCSLFETVWNERALIFNCKSTIFSPSVSAYEANPIDPIVVENLIKRTSIQADPICPTYSKQPNWKLLACW